MCVILSTSKARCKLYMHGAQSSITSVARYMFILYNWDILDSFFIGSYGYFLFIKTMANNTRPSLNLGERIIQTSYVFFKIRNHIFCKELVILVLAQMS